MPTKFNTFYDIISVVLMLVFKAILDISYVFILYPNYAYAGFGLSYSMSSILIGFLMFFPLVFFLPKKIDKPSDLLLFLLFIFMYAPLLTMFSYSGQIEFSTAFINMIFWLVVFLIVYVIPEFSLPEIKKFSTVWVIPVVFVLMFVYILTTAIIYTDFDIIDSLINFLDVYERRTEYKEAHIPFSGYLYQWSGNVIFPCAAMFFLLKKNVPGVLAVLFASLVSFAVTGFKSQMFAIVLVVLIYLLLKVKKRFIFGETILIMIVLGTIVIYAFFDDIVSYSMVVRRSMFLPVQIVQYYFDAFENAPIFSSNSVLSSLIEYPYEVEPPFIIGSIYYNSPQTHANTGIIADGFINFGYVGVIIWAVVFGLLMKLTDSVSKNKSFALSLSAIALFSVAFSNSALFTVAGTHGYYVALVLIYLSPDEAYFNKKRNKLSKGTKQNV